MKIRNNKGFTLMELIVVIAIMGIVMGVVVPNVPKLMQRQRVKADKITAQEIASKIRLWYIDQKYDGEYTTEGDEVTFSDLKDIYPRSGSVTPCKYSDLLKIDTRLSSDLVPESFEPGGNKPNNPYFGVYLSSEEDNAKIIITIQEEDDGNLTEITHSSIEDYDGTKAGIVYVE